MASKCRNMFHKNKKQETTEIDSGNIVFSSAPSRPRSGGRCPQQDGVMFRKGPYKILLIGKLSSFALSTPFGLRPIAIVSGGIEGDVERTGGDDTRLHRGREDGDLPSCRNLGDPGRQVRQHNGPTRRTIVSQTRSNKYHHVLNQKVGVEGEEARAHKNRQPVLRGAEGGGGGRGAHEGVGGRHASRPGVGATPGLYIRGHAATGTPLVPHRSRYSQCR
ncbi:hypothetical protein AAG570_002881 [Ranatra chinensis]|uniref:Uncharacterized protein n=1 Tax=Ranatra chinensis TaxID=642074 RepID=A0ABD0Y545_9HEMI